MSKLLGLVLLALTNAADYVTFLGMYQRHGLGSELNPIVVLIAQEHGLLFLGFVKLFVIMLMATVFLVVVKYKPRYAWAMLAIGIATGAVGAWSNG